MRAARVILAIGCLALGSVRTASATTITFDGNIASPQPPQVFGSVAHPDVDEDYTAPGVPPSPNLAFATQGYNFGGFIAGLPGRATNSTPTLSIIKDAANCPDITGGSPCAVDGSQYLATEEEFGFVRSTPGTFAFKSFDIGAIFPKGCPGCDGGAGLGNITDIDVFAFLNGQVVAQQDFDLTGLVGFETLVLSDPGFANVARIAFTTNGPHGAAALDNFVVQDTVPEPATLLLLGTGIAAVARKRFSK